MYWMSTELAYILCFANENAFPRGHHGEVHPCPPNPSKTVSVNNFSEKIGNKSGKNEKKMSSKGDRNLKYLLKIDQTLVLRSCKKIRSVPFID